MNTSIIFLGNGSGIDDGEPNEIDEGFFFSGAITTTPNT